ncbi:hypothetical protein PA7_26870 [Pseudonocardia asaccharolytica DSM 44247 = NBRC 16224]|uniref:Uncharacterized protein n=1 Tax=Pseudonocardia asaccharolytica DSM 44247 = NBRC 16224 TaxID=1123024 RepID=A0A511D242_9PSEU|nr:hypothetical protein PA7_26870 [Pseudonocardia asaccharolytica DSM 44247 = NBRC 16224]
MGAPIAVAFLREPCSKDREAGHLSVGLSVRRRPRFHRAGRRAAPARTGR